MKSHILSKAFALLALAAAPALADSSPMYEAPLTDDDQLSLACVDVDFAYMTDLDGNLTVDNLYGGTITIGYTFNATKTSYHKLGLSVGVLYGDEKNSTSICMGQDLVDFGYSASDFRMDASEKFTQQIIPVVVEYSYHRAVTSDFSVSIGVRAGVNISKTSHDSLIFAGGKYWSDLYDFQLSEYKDGDRMGSNELNHTRIAPVFGVGCGVEYNISDNWKWNAGVDFDFSQGLIRERNYQEINADLGSAVESKDIITTTIHTGFSYSF